MVKKRRVAKKSVAEGREIHFHAHADDNLKLAVAGIESRLRDMEAYGRYQSNVMVQLLEVAQQLIAELHFERRTKREVEAHHARVMAAEAGHPPKENGLA